MKITTIDIPIYFGYFRIVVTKNFKKAVKKLNIDTKGMNVKNYGAFADNDTTDEGYFRYTVLLPPKPSHSLIAHEAVYLVNSLFINVGITPCRINDEPQAYLTGWFVGEVYKALKRN